MDLQLRSIFGFQFIPEEVGFYFIQEGWKLILYKLTDI
jgi:hypothetical protein